jgi:hypothetical protein
VVIEDFIVESLGLLDNAWHDEIHSNEAEVEGEQQGKVMLWKRMCKR